MLALLWTALADAASQGAPHALEPVSITIEESITVADAPVALPPAVITIEESITVADAPLVAPPAVITVNEAITITDAPLVLPPAVVTVNESITVTDAPLVLPPAVVTVNEAITVADAPVALPPAVVTVNETITVADAPLVAPPAVVTVNETITVADAPLVLPPAVITVNEAITVADAPLVLPPAVITVNEAITVADAPLVLPPAVITVNEAITVADAPPVLPPVDLWVSKTGPPGPVQLGDSVTYALKVGNGPPFIGFVGNRAQDARFNVPIGSLPNVGGAPTQGFMAYDASGPREPYFGSTAYARVSSPRPNVAPYAAASTQIAGFDSLSVLSPDGLAYDVSGMLIDTTRILDLRGEGRLRDDDPRFQDPHVLFYYLDANGHRSEKRTYVGGSFSLINRSTGLAEATGAASFLTLLVDYDAGQIKGWGEIALAPGSDLYEELTARYGSARLFLVGVTNTSPVFEDSPAGVPTAERYAVYNASFTLVPVQAFVIGTPATGVTVVDTLPAGVAFVSATASQGSCHEAGGAVRCDIGSLAGGATATATIVVRASAPGTHVNTATVMADQFDLDASNNAGTAITRVNGPAVAANDSYGVDEDTLLIIGAPGVLANDADPDGDPLRALLASGPAHGTLALNVTGSFTYTPTLDYSGPDSFTYVANDGALDSNVATVTITVRPVNDSPAATGDSYTTNEDTLLIIGAPGVLGNDTDLDGDPLRALLVSGPVHGTLALNVTGSFTYTPSLDYNGPDSFTYRASDGALDSNVATVTITVRPVNDPPILLPIGQMAGQYSDPVGYKTSGTQNVPSSFTIVGSDVDNSCAELAFTAVGLPGNLTIVNNGGCTATVRGRVVAPAGTYPVVYTIADGTGGFATRTANLIIERESAQVRYTGDRMASGPAAGVAVNLRASITEDLDGSPGTAVDPTNAPGVVFSICDVLPSLRQAKCYEVPATSVAATDVPGVWAAVARSSLPVGRWRVVVRFVPGNRYFAGPDSPSAFISTGPDRAPPATSK
ncbi:MAG: tandem-95 repeat protein [Chloroflexota bacterium]|nr:tandem-95 repeat protein [Chloroflexota bacterium]